MPTVIATQPAPIATLQVVDRKKLFAVFDTLSGSPDYAYFHAVTPHRETAKKAVQGLHRHKNVSKDDRTRLCQVEVEFLDGYRPVALSWWRWDWLPSHALDMPERLLDRDSDEGYSEAGTLMTRDEGLAFVIERNIEEFDAYETVDHPAWWALLQIDKSLRKELWNIDLYEDYGHEDVSYVRPVRVVRPTEEEIARFNPQRFEWEGGAI